MAVCVVITNNHSHDDLTDLLYAVSVWLSKNIAACEVGRCSLRTSKSNNLELVKDVRLIPLVHAHACTCHFLLHAGIVLDRSALLILSHCVTTKVGKSCVQGAFCFLRSLRIGLANVLARYAVASHSRQTHLYYSANKIQRQPIPQHRLNKHSQCKYVYPAHHRVRVPCPT
jgi:hypothetical protein